MKRPALLAAFLAASAGVIAQTTPPQCVYYKADLGVASWNAELSEHKSYQSAATEGTSLFATKQQSTCTPTGQNEAVLMQYEAVNVTESSFSIRRFCPLPSPAADTHYVRYISKVTKNCTCTQGVSQTMTVRLGFARYTARSDGAFWATADGRGYLAMPGAGSMPPSIPSKICRDSCEMVLMTSASPAGDYWISDEPNGEGLFEVTRKGTYDNTGSTCEAKDEPTPENPNPTPTPNTPAIDPAAPSPPCDGFKGEVNGKEVCAAKQDPSGFDGHKPKITNSPTGSNPTQSTDTTGQGKGMGPNGEKPGKPSDTPGSKDLSGTGKPVNGGGSGTGGSGGSGTVPTVAGQEQAACGAPGQPMCKIDESGTKDGKDALKAGEDALKAGEKSATDEIGKAKDLKAPPWTWTFQLPTGCSPFVLSAYEIVIDICQYQSMIHSLLSMCWLMAATFLCLRMVHSTMTRV